MYGTVTIARDHPNSVSMGRRKRLNELMPLEVKVTTAAQTKSTAFRENRMREVILDLALFQIRGIVNSNLI
jgi:hypothetical protein